MGSCKPKSIPTKHKVWEYVICHTISKLELKKRLNQTGAKTSHLYTYIKMTTNHSNYIIIYALNNNKSIAKENNQSFSLPKAKTGSTKCAAEQILG